MYIFIALVFFVIIPIACFYFMRDNKKLDNQLEAALKASKGVEDADAYFVAKKAEADALISSVNRSVDDLEKKKKTIQEKIDSLNISKSALEKELTALELDALVGMVHIDAYENLKSDEVKNKLSLLRIRQGEMVKTGEALNVSASAPKKILDSQKKQILRCFNAEASSIIENITVKNVDTSRSKIQRAFEAINKIFAVDGVQISPEYLESKYEELSMVYAYMLKLDEEAEQRKAIREQMVEEEKVRREIEQAKKKIEKEEAQFTNEINKLMSYMSKSKDEVERKLYADKISEIQDKLKDIESSKENVLQREQNTRAGFVYIISNIGAFGEGVFKIGMTRRLEPMDRISELSSASVPFPFDVHALIFSDDAPGLENILHQHFDKVRVNKVNPRKEFFKIDLEEIKRVVLENHNATVKFVDIPDATEYRETLKMCEGSNG